MRYEVTVRNRHDEKIVRRWDVDDDSKTLHDIIEEAQRSDRVNGLIDEFRHKYKVSSLKYFWCPDLMPVHPPPQPKPEPVKFDVLVNSHSV